LTEIIQFTDIHLDLDYEAGTNSDCGLPICCRAPNGPPKNQTYSAGRYGHFGCALPETALKAIYKDAATRYPVFNSYQ
jgi:sphingomyelin phosphodiesterase